MSKLYELLNTMIDKVNSSVKTTAQNMTEEEKANVKSNLGYTTPEDIPAQVQADWNQSNSTAPDYVKNKTHYIAYDSIESSDSVTAIQRIYARVEIKVTDKKLIVKLGSSDYGVKFQENAYIVIYVEGSRYDVDLAAFEATTYKEPLTIDVGYHNGYAVKCTCRPSGRSIQITGIVQFATYEEGLENPNLPKPKMRIEYGTTTLVPLDEIYIPDNIPKVQTATVGQTVLVKAVDENGKPTEWEASDFPSDQVTPDMVMEILYETGAITPVADSDGSVISTSDDEILIL